MKYWDHDLLSNTVDEASSTLHDATGLALSKLIGKLQVEAKVCTDLYRVTREYRKHFLGVLLTKILVTYVEVESYTK
jgi:hypothetical protein